MGKEFLDTLIGLSENEAKKICLEHDFSVRVVRRDEERFCVTMDIKFNRVNLDIDGELVTKCDIG